MGPGNATEHMQRELDRAMDTLRTDLDRVELLTAAMCAFSRPVPEYEPSFRHVHRMQLGAHEMGED